MALFRRPNKVSPNEIDALLGLRPLRDDILSYLLQRAFDGLLPVYSAAVPRDLIRPFDPQYDPTEEPVGAAAVELTMAEWQAGRFQHVWVYPAVDTYVLADDYIAWAAAERGHPEFLPCWVLGYPSVAGAVDVRGPIDLERVRRLLGAGESDDTSGDVSREEARAIAEAIILERGLGSGVRNVLLLEEITSRRPNIFGGPTLEECWIAYAERPVRGLGASCVVLIAKETGEVLYAGSANDEG